MLDQGDIAFNDLLDHIVGGGIVFHSVVFCFRADMVGGFVQQIALAGSDLTHRPVVAADIIFCSELTVRIGGVDVNELFTLVNPVNGAGERSVALWQPRFGIAFGDGDIPFFQNVRKALFCDGVPFHRRCLIFGNDIADRRIDFLQRVACADQHIPEIRLAGAVGHGVFIHRKP